MAFPTSPLALLLVTLGFALPLAQADEAPPATAPVRELVVSVVEPVDGRRIDTDLYNRFARVFTTEFEARQWPFKLRVERFGANSPDHPIDMRVFLQPIRQELPDQWTFRAWLKLTVDGHVHDFGIIRSDFTPRPLQAMDEVLDRLVQGAARRIADKISTVLLPSTAAAPGETPSLANQLIITISEPASSNLSASGLYYRVSGTFLREFEARRWPLSIKAERFAANIPDRALQLHLALDPIESSDRFRAWMKLRIRGTEHDLGLVQFHYPARQWQQPDEVVERSIEGAARITADKLTAILFPKTAAQPAR